ncbi:tripartite tricarboxylate transporter TctB family protein [Shimia sp. MMG029]|uniref:tripartite tricarboxylate transporter TctB family protein n=1 Tax=Shimia sp. MMG029 TaxID=3021978 RepID=UPI0022FE6ED7|nr:tripartite tricarboxylate transporter TctB family protein [Shimia sp. MMG029]MDA5558154.1 tripartite tricarboxylate transporter TctB family protein [Shimia sp. MMG029]
MTKPLFRGILITVLFAFVAFVLIPIHVPRPAFIPGFAPPPDMWPRVISIIGMGLGLVAFCLTLLGKGEAEDPAPKSDGAPTKTLILRAFGAASAFVGFIVILPIVGFAIGAMLLTGVCILLTGERGHVIWAVAISVLGPLALTFFFHKALGTQFPQGVLGPVIGL